MDALLQESFGPKTRKFHVAPDRRPSTLSNDAVLIALREAVPRHFALRESRCESPALTLGDVPRADLLDVRQCLRAVAEAMPPMCARRHEVRSLFDFAPLHGEADTVLPRPRGVPSARAPSAAGRVTPRIAAQHAMSHAGQRPRAARTGADAGSAAASHFAGQHRLVLRDWTLAQSVDSFLAYQDTEGCATAGARCDGAARGAQEAATGPKEELLVCKLLRQTRQSGTSLMALLPESVSVHVPIMVARLLSSLVPSAHASALWIVPGDSVAPLMRFLSLLGQLHSIGQLVVRELAGVPGAGSEPQLRHSELGVLPLPVLQKCAPMARHNNSGHNNSAADLVVLTASASSLPVLPDAVRQLLAVGAAGAPRLVAILCGKLPDEGNLGALIPACTALGVRRLVMRAERDPDVCVLKSYRRTYAFTSPSELVDTCRGLHRMARRELLEVRRRRATAT